MNRRRRPCPKHSKSGKLGSAGTICIFTPCARLQGERGRGIITAMNSTTPNADAPANNLPRRLESLDALRGFDMLMIMGLAPLVTALCVLFGWGGDCALAQQFRHVEWNGLRFEDTIFPLFLFLAGVSWPFSCAAQRERGASTRAIVLRCLKRAVLIFLLGLLFEGRLRIGSVLGRIGIAWMIGAMLHVFFRPRTLAVLAFVLPLAYWLAMYFFPAPDAAALVVPKSLEFVKDFGTGPFSIVGNLSGWVDRHFMPGVLSPYTGIADNQSALGFIPAASTALLGILSGEFLRSSRSMPPTRRIGLMLLAAAVLAALGLAVANCFGHMSMPINKKLWSASFVFVVGGYSVAMLAVFHLLVDVMGLSRWAFFFKVIGMNSITIYLAQRFIQFKVVAGNILGEAPRAAANAAGAVHLTGGRGLAGLLSPAAGEVLLAAGYIAVCWLFLFFLYRRKIFLKV